MELGKTNTVVTKLSFSQAKILVGMSFGDYVAYRILSVISFFKKV
jgi:hypothetical protein